MTIKIILATIALLSSSQLSRADCTVTVPNSCFCSAYGTSNNVKLTVAQVIKASGQKWSSTSIAVSEGTFPSWWGAYPTNAVSYWNGTDLTVTEGPGGIVIYYVTNETAWKALIDAEKAYNANLSYYTPAFTHAEGALISSAVIYVNCVYVLDNSWNDGDSGGYDAFHVYAHEIGRTTSLR